MPRKSSEGEEIIKKSGVVVSQSTAVISGKFFEKRTRFDSNKNASRFVTK